MFLKFVIFAKFHIFISLRKILKYLNQIFVALFIQYESWSSLKYFFERIRHSSMQMGCNQTIEREFKKKLQKLQIPFKKINYQIDEWLYFQQINPFILRQADRISSISFLLQPPQRKPHLKETSEKIRGCTLNNKFSYSSFSFNNSPKLTQDGHQRGRSSLVPHIHSHTHKGGWSKARTDSVGGTGGEKHGKKVTHSGNAIYLPLLWHGVT